MAFGIPPSGCLLRGGRTNSNASEAFLDMQSLSDQFTDISRTEDASVTVFDPPASLKRDPVLSLPPVPPTRVS